MRKSRVSWHKQTRKLNSLLAQQHELQLSYSVLIKNSLLFSSFMGVLAYSEDICFLEAEI